MTIIGGGIGLDDGAMGSVTEWNTVASYPAYDQARSAVDYLAEQNFPVENLDIVGSDLRLVERVTGRVTPGGTAAAGAATGAWFGLFMGLLVGLFTAGPLWLGLIVGGLVIGALWGAIFGGVGYLALRGRHEFGSTSKLVARRYDVVSRGGYAGRARTMLEAGNLADASDSGRI